MRLREHPKLSWPPAWSEWAKRSPMAEVGTLKEIDLIERDQGGPTRLLLAGEFKGKVRFAEITCDNATFVRRLYEKIKPLCGRVIKEVGDLEIDG
ncbi:MAG: hypothetical protein ACE5JU_02070 [Candidatus Binatia bacterium]